MTDTFLKYELTLMELLSYLKDSGWLVDDNNIFINDYIFSLSINYIYESNNLKYYLILYQKINTIQNIQLVKISLSDGTTQDIISTKNYNQIEYKPLDEVSTQLQDLIKVISFYFKPNSIKFIFSED